MPLLLLAPGPAPTRLGRRGIERVAVLALVAAAYGAFAGRYFTSEDFLLVRFLREHPPWHELARQWTRPWLEIAGIEFFRPLASLLYGVEAVLFGAHAVPYNLVHIAAHAGSALMVLEVARQAHAALDVTAGPGALFAAVLFALYPLHPNAVLFGASFATLFAGAFQLGAVLCWQRAAAGGGRWLAASFALYLAALTSYEAAVVLPVVLVSFDLLARRDRLTAIARRSLPFWLASAAYLSWRWLLFGHVIGGYPETSQRLTSLPLAAGADLAWSLARLQLPWYERQWPGMAVAALCVAPLLPLAVAGRLSRSRPALRVAAWGWVWAVAAMAPFAFRPAVPGNGRYWYFAAAGLALAWSATAQAIAVQGPRARAAAWLVLAGVAAGHGSLLWRYLGENYQAGEQARTFVGALAARAVRDGAVGIVGAPAHLENAAGVPLAPVFHWGLRDAAGPPFRRPAVDLYPLPALPDAALAPLAEAGIELLRWRDGGQLERVSPPAAAGAALEVLAPETGVRLRADAATFTLRSRPGAARYRLVLVAPGNDWTADIDAPHDAAEIQGRMPRDFLATHARLYGPEAEFLWWVEALDGERPLAHSPVRRFRIEAGG